MLRTDAQASTISSEFSAADVTRWVGVVVLLASIWTLAILPTRVVSEGWTPRDDALRHAAKVVSGRDWNDVLVLRDPIVDPHPGWHALLGLVRQAGVTRARALVSFSVIALAALVMLAPLAGFRRPEAWLLALLVGVLTEPQFLQRLFLGRPYLGSMAVLLLLGSVWKRLDTERPPLDLMAGLAALLAVANWVHGNGYLWVLPLAAFVLAGELRVATRVAVCIVVGTAIAALLTGNPLAFLLQTFVHPFRALGGDEPTWLLVTEFQPSSGSPAFLALAGVVVVALWTRDLRTTIAAAAPLLWLAIGGWVLGLHTVRFWTDWGMPAALILLARLIEARLETEWPVRTLTYAVGALMVCAALTFAISMDRGRRWSNNAWIANEALFTEKNREWLPDSGGILYNKDMTVFYQGFFLNPEAPYRYLLGFEPALLPDRDLKELRDIQSRNASDESLRPWVERLRPADRIEISREGSAAPAGYPQMEWFSPQPNIWMGRLRR